MTSIAARRRAVLCWTFAKFAAVGVVNTLLTLGVIFALKLWFEMHDAAANAIGYAVGLACSFAFNKRWTFRHQGAALEALARFLAVFIGAYAVNIGVVMTLIAVEFNDYLAHVVGMPLYTIVFFAGCRRFVFRTSADRAVA